MRATRCLLPRRPPPSALCHRLLEAVACGRKRSCGVDDKAKPCPRFPRPRESKRLVELLQAKPSDSDSGCDEMVEAETRRKSDAFEELRRGSLEFDLNIPSSHLFAL
ncbi:hypothetical protein OPV22_032133 [Ensete ventricosum]|uniref:Uncharacterized protein n=1 Tax=Ensete ventricosum TaxID=4639 RepID=A0A445M9I5_ENSVE|nr:hypothetical protein OPV22_032133 [Ensete ventricosum]RWW81862.1 hypothetical protein BHE74_00009707 [Ensete ventricosum]RZR70854.1 hypothetical protein BHM03_00001939 [Ensete ventricosum]